MNEVWCGTWGKGAIASLEFFGGVVVGGGRKGGREEGREEGRKEGRNGGMEEGIDF